MAYVGLYDGIDLNTWGQRDSLKYEFHVAPGADHAQIQITYNNLQGLWLDEVAALLSACSVVGAVVAVVVALSLPKFWLKLFIGLIVLSMGILILSAPRKRGLPTLAAS